VAVGVDQSRCDDVAARVDDLGVDISEGGRHRFDEAVLDQDVALRKLADVRVHRQDVSGSNESAPSRHADRPPLVVALSGAVLWSLSHRSQPGERPAIISQIGCDVAER
jgi:hypothetical protein